MRLQKLWGLKISLTSPDFSRNIRIFRQKSIKKNKLDKVFGEGACRVLKIRPFGGVKVFKRKMYSFGNRADQSKRAARESGKWFYGSDWKQAVCS